MQMTVAARRGGINASNTKFNHSIWLVNAGVNNISKIFLCFVRVHGCFDASVYCKLDPLSSHSLCFLDRFLSLSFCSFLFIFDRCREEFMLKGLFGAPTFSRIQFQKAL